MAAPLASSMVRRRPRVSKRAPVRMRPRPLHTASTPTRVVDRAALAPTERERSFEKEITVLPMAARKMMHRKARQKVKRRSIWPVV